MNKNLKSTTNGKRFKLSRKNSIITLLNFESCENIFAKYKMIKISNNTKELDISANAKIVLFLFLVFVIFETFTKSSKNTLSLSNMSLFLY